MPRQSRVDWSSIITRSPLTPEILAHTNRFSATLSKLTVIRSDQQNLHGSCTIRLTPNSFATCGRGVVGSVLAVRPKRPSVVLQLEKLPDIASTNPSATYPSDDWSPSTRNGRTATDFAGDLEASPSYQQREIQSCEWRKPNVWSWEGEKCRVEEESPLLRYTTSVFRQPGRESEPCVRP